MDGMSPEYGMTDPPQKMNAVATCRDTGRASTLGWVESTTFQSLSLTGNLESRARVRGRAATRSVIPYPVGISASLVSEVSAVVFAAS